MLDVALDNALADHKTYGNVGVQHQLLARLRRDDSVHWTEPDGYRPFWTITKYPRHSNLALPLCGPQK